MRPYRGTGEGSWHGDWFVYVPSPEDWATGNRIATATADRVRAARRKASARYGDPDEVRASWYASGFMGEVAALYPLGSGPDLDAWEGVGRWYHRPDYGTRTEVRTSSSLSLGIVAGRYPPLGGWRVTAKDAGRILLCVEHRGADLAVHGYVEADSVPRLPAPLGGIIAVVEPNDLTPFRSAFP